MTLDPLTIFDRRREPTTALHDLLAGRPAFLIGGGPSLNSLPFETLRMRGVWSMAINNVAAHPQLRPQAFICADPPSKFSHCIWRDPSVMKFIPLPKLKGYRGSLRRKDENGQFVPDGRAEERPNVWAYSRRSWMQPDDSFFTEEAAWGNHRAGELRTGQPRTVCTLLLGMRLLRALGASKIYLLGVDWYMPEGQGYSFNQHRDQAASASNNSQYDIAGQWMTKMQNEGVFERAGLTIKNCNRHSRLTAFPFVSFDEALTDMTGDIEQKPDLSNWYEKS